MPLAASRSLGPFERNKNGGERLATLAAVLGYQELRLPQEAGYFASALLCFGKTKVKVFISVAM
jgi:hypothetical protein